MKPLFLLSFIFLLSKHSPGQDTVFIVDAGIKVNDLLPSNVLYQYTEFLNGKVFYRNGIVFDGKLNYNRLMDEMQFISEKGDTLALRNEPTIRFVFIDKDTFYWDRGFVMSVKNSGTLKLAAKQGFKIVDIKSKAAAYDMMSSTSSVSSLSSFNDGTVSYELAVKGKMQLSETTKYYFGNKYGHFVLANKKNLLDLFQACAVQINRFVRKNKIDFSPSCVKG